MIEDLETADQLGNGVVVSAAPLWGLVKDHTDNKEVVGYLKKVGILHEGEDPRTILKGNVVRYFFNSEEESSSVAIVYLDRHNSYSVQKEIRESVLTLNMRGFVVAGLEGFPYGRELDFSTLGNKTLGSMTSMDLSGRLIGRGLTGNDCTSRPAQRIKEVDARQETVLGIMAAECLLGPGIKTFGIDEQKLFINGVKLMRSDLGLGEFGRYALMAQIQAGRAIVMARVVKSLARMPSKGVVFAIGHTHWSEIEEQLYSVGQSFIIIKPKSLIK